MTPLMIMTKQGGLDLVAETVARSSPGLKFSYANIKSKVGCNAHNNNGRLCIVSTEQALREVR